MKKILTVLFLFICIRQFYCQDYLNIKYNDSTYQYALTDDISEISFNTAGTEMTVILTDASSHTIALNTIAEMTYDASILGGGTPLPVELVSFTAALSNSGTVSLNWQTVTEVNNYGFQVQREKHEDKIENGWINLGFVQGHGTTNSPKSYSFTDSDLPNVGQVDYRLKQIDNDGTFAFSKVVTVELKAITSVDDEVKYNFNLEQNYPNPFNSSTTITFSVPTVNKKYRILGNTKLVVYDILGGEIETLVNKELKAGEYKIDFNGNNLPSGIYFCRLNVGKYSALIKMIMLK